jgi:hypothetical protein
MAVLNFSSSARKLPIIVTEDGMLRRSAMGAIALVATLSLAGARAGAQELLRFPDWSGQWERINGLAGGSFDPSKRPGRAQQPPLTAEYRAVWEANMAESDAGGQNYNTQAHCLPGGMPRMMIAYQPMETIVTPETTYIHIAFFHELRRIYTDGRDWPAVITPTFSGYSIGRWLDADGSGRLSTLEVETRGLRGPRIFDPSGIPFHKDNQTIIRERVYLDKADPDVLRDEITVLDHALTRPWTAIRSYNRIRNPTWIEDVCGENNQYVFLRGESYLRAADGNLMPTRKDQSPPDLRNFDRASK